MPGRFLIPGWTPADMPPVLIPGITSVLLGLYILAYPPSTSRGRKLAILLLSIPLWTAFRHAEHLAPNHDVVDTAARACLIWLIHMSYEICVLEYAPDVQAGPGEMKERFRQAYKVFFDRSRDQVVEQRRKAAMRKTSDTTTTTTTTTTTVTDKKTDEVISAPASKTASTRVSNYQHGYSRWQFVLYHVVKAGLLQAVLTAWFAYEDHISPLRRDPWAYANYDHIAFFSRLPGSLHYTGLYWRVEEMFSWCIVTMLIYEKYHSIAATLHVGLGIDAADEWSLRLYGSLADAWSVRRYWGRYWHNFIYHSFVGHVKCLTRGWLRMRRGRLTTRVVENTLVFFASGIMHSVVRWQEEPWADLWSVTILYTAQMIPILIEGIVAYYWAKARRACGFAPDNKWLNRAEYAVGYFWCFSWHCYSISTYWLVRDKWTEEKLSKIYTAEQWDAAVNETDLDI